MANQIYFTADLHFGHTNILKHSPNRPFSDTVDIKAHDEWLPDLWRSTVDKKDTIYILGDLTFLKSEDARHLLEKLPGRLHHLRRIREQQLQIRSKINGMVGLKSHLPQLHAIQHIVLHTIDFAVPALMEMTVIPILQRMVLRIQIA